MTAFALTRKTESVRFPDGSIIELRPIGIRDGRMVSNFVSQLSPESDYKRFLSAGSGVRNEWVANRINADQVDCLVYGAVAGNEFGHSMVAIAESIRDPGDAQRAEFALAAINLWQNMGIGTLLTRHVARIARSTGIRFWETYMLAENTQMGRVMRNVGSPVSFDVEHGLAHVVHDISA